MKVAFLTASLSRRAGGLLPIMRELPGELSRVGLRLTVFGLRDEYTDEDAASWNGAEIRTYEVAGPRSFGYAPLLWRGLKALDADLVHTHGLWMYPSVVSLRWARSRGKPCLISPHGMLDPWALRHSAWKKRLAGWLYEDRNLGGAACIHALCEAEAASVRAYGLRNPVCVIPNGVDVPENARAFAPGWADGVPEQAKVLLYLGRLHPKKGLPNLLRTWGSLLPAARREWVLVVAGWDQGGHEAELKRMGRELGLGNSVVFVGPQFGEQKEASFGRADAFVLPSFSEGLPVTVLEAWAYGLPVLMTPQCNLPEGFQASAALRIEPDPESIGRGLVELLGMSDAERREMGRRGRRLVEGKFSWPRIAAEMKSVYEWVLGGGPKPDSVRSA